ncbi:MAG: HAD domain-containing protein [Lachnospiraceae bacterium]|nr:HAD domain-containing protein [Lachnospiraceae bacterium]
MKIIFLDIDGVLNSTQFYERKSNNELLEEPFDRNNALQLKRIVEATDAKVVLTSTWRGGWHKNPVLCTLEGKLLNQLFSSLGISIYDKTPVLKEGRAAEIKAYLESCPEKVSAYVIIDDNDFHWKKNGLARHVVQTDFENGGLKEEHADQSIAILNENLLSRFRRLCPI